MCYSKEVSLATSGIIFASTGHAWYRYVIGDAARKYKALDPRMREFLRNALIGFAMIGVHQFFEFLSVWTGNQFIYKIGLLASISFTYFMLRSLEKLTRHAFGSPVFLAVIAVLGVSLFAQDMRFENAHFYVRGFSHFAWSMTWMMLFLYWNCCVVNVAFQMRHTESRSLLLLYPWVFANFTYVLMLLYALAAMRVETGGLCAIQGAASCAGLGAALGDFKGLYDVASIWCALAVVSVMFFPKYFRALRERFKPSELDLVQGVTFPQAAGYVLLSGFMLLFLFKYLPILGYIGLRMLTK